MGDRPRDDDVARALAAVEAAWDVVRRAPRVTTALGLPLDRLPEVTEEAVEARAAEARRVLDALAPIDVATLPHELGLTLEVAREQMTVRARAGEWYWLVVDPLDVGFYAMHAPTAYCGGFLLDHLTTLLAGHAFAGAGDVDRYLGLLEDLGRLVGQLDVRTRGQAERGIHLPVAQLAQARALLPGLRSIAAGALVPGADRLPDDGARARVAERVETAVLPAYDAWTGWLDDPQRDDDADDAVGLGRLPGGDEVYAELVRLHTTLDLSPQEIHERGLARLQVVRAEMQAVLDEEGATHTVHEHLDVLARDPAWRAEGAEAVAAVFERYIERLRPVVGTAFHLTPRADYGVEALPEAMATSMTFGYYAAPSAAQPRGCYFFNATNLSGQSLAHVAALTYHELVPGHHFHRASQQEDDGLHPLRRHSFFNVFNEGWAEYAAALAGELGMYDAPAERFGKLVMDAFLTTRLVVDTGMSALGWTLEQARDFMREHAFVSESEVLTESVRYSCDLPAQSLAYKLGDVVLRDLRDTMADALGDRFDLRDFHDAVLRPGALPLRLVRDNVDRATTAALSRTGGTRP